MMYKPCGFICVVSLFKSSLKNILNSFYTQKKPTKGSFFKFHVTVLTAKIQNFHFIYE